MEARPLKGLPRLAAILGLAVAYFLSARLGLLTSVVQDNVTLAWPPTGIALAALLLYGPGLWPGLVLGAFAATSSTGAPALFALGTALGNPLAAVAGWWLLTSCADFRPELCRARDVISLFCLGGFVPAVASATNGTAFLWLAGMVPPAAIPSIWWVWWLGDAMGAVLLAPALLGWAPALPGWAAALPGWAAAPPARPDARAHAEFLLLLAAAGAASYAIYFQPSPHGLGQSLPFAAFPFAIWAALRLGVRETALVSATVSALAVTATACGLGPFASPSVTMSLLYLHLFLLAFTGASQLLAAVACARRRAEQELTLGNRELAQRVRERTAEIQQANAELSVIFDNVPAGIWYKDDRNVFLRCNKTGAAMVGLPPEAFRNAKTEDLFPAEAAKYYRDDLEVLASGRPKLGILEELRTARGELRHVRTDKLPVPDPSGLRTGLLVFSQDVTNERRRERELLEARQAAEMASRSKSEFLANMSHEIRTPLNGILGVLQLLGVTGLDDEQREYVEAGLAAGRGLMTIINDILDLSKMDSGRIELTPRPFEPEHLLHTVRSALAGQASRKGVTLTCSLAPSVPPVLVGDDVRLRQILFNLMGNAIKFTDSGRVDVEVALRPTSKPDQGRLVVFISDTGIGIPPDKLAHIFEPFSQAEDSHTRRHHGVGLGLPIAKRLVTLMGGEISLESEPGQGTTAAFDVPVDLPSARPPAEIRPKPGLDKTFGHGRKLLLVEDDKINRMSLKGMLDKLGYETIPAADGQEALDILARSTVDAVLMDVQMPVMDGLEATRRIRAGDAGEAARPLPILAVTAHANKGDREDFLAAGMDDYLSKPLDLADLDAALRKILNRN